MSSQDDVPVDKELRIEQLHKQQVDSGHTAQQQQLEQVGGSQEHSTAHHGQQHTECKILQHRYEILVQHHEMLHQVTKL